MGQNTNYNVCNPGEDLQETFHLFHCQPGILVNFCNSSNTDFQINFKIILFELLEYFFLHSLFHSCTYHQHYRFIQSSLSGTICRIRSCQILFSPTIQTFYLSEFCKCQEVCISVCAVCTSVTIPSFLIMAYERFSSCEIWEGKRTKHRQ